MEIGPDEKQVEDLREWFSKYVQNFHEEDAQHQANILLKKEHSLRVCGEILDISREMGLGAGEQRLAQVIALLHDIGRFEQYARYRTFADRKSVNHAELGVQVIRSNGALEGWQEGLKELVLRAVEYHNRAELPKDETETCLFFSRLLRDADKLDIWYVTTEYYAESAKKRNSTIELGLPDSDEISREVRDALIKGSIVKVNHLRTLNDFKLLQVGWAFDLNFEPTVRQALQRHYLDKIRLFLPKTGEVDEIFEAVYAHIKKNKIVAEKTLERLQMLKK